MYQLATCENFERLQGYPNRDMALAPVMSRRRPPPADWLDASPGPGHTAEAGAGGRVSRRRRRAGPLPVRSARGARCGTTQSGSARPLSGSARAGSEMHLREKCFYRMLYETVTRAEEILPLNIENLDFAGRRALVKAKGAKTKARRRGQVREDFVLETVYWGRRHRPAASTAAATAAEEPRQRPGVRHPPPPRTGQGRLVAGRVPGHRAGPAVIRAGPRLARCRCARFIQLVQRGAGPGRRICRWSTPSRAWPLGRLAGRWGHGPHARQGRTPDPARSVRVSHRLRRLIRGRGP
jgi:Phage integrase family